MESFSSMLRQAREAKGVTQSELAQAAGMNTSHYNRIERGLRNPPSRAKVTALADVLGLEPAGRNQLLVAAGYAPEDLRGLTGEWVSKLSMVASGSTRPRIDDTWQGGSLASLELATAVVRELLSLTNNVEIKQHDRDVITRALGALPEFLRVMNKILSSPVKGGGGLNFVVTSSGDSPPENDPTVVQKVEQWMEKAERANGNGLSDSPTVTIHNLLTPQGSG